MKLIKIICLINLFVFSNCTNNKQLTLPFKKQSIVSEQKIKKHILYIVINKDSESLFDSYSAFITDNKSIKKLFDLSKISLKSKLIKIKEDYYIFDYFTGGNHVNAKCYQLIKITKDNVIVIGKFKEYKDIDNDGKKDFTLMVVEKTGKSRADFKYKEIKIPIVNNQFVYPNNQFEQ